MGKLTMLAEISGLGVEHVVFILASLATLLSAVGVVTSRSPVHSALSLVATLFGVAVLFVAQDAHFLAAVQVIVYAGAIVVLFLFVIMLLGVDRLEDIETEPLVAQRPLALLAGAAFAVLAGLVYALTDRDFGGIVTGAPSQAGVLARSGSQNVTNLATSVFTDYLYAFEITSVLLIIAVVGAVVLARRTPEPDETSP
ncbi:MAG: NADH-quinone oxidoreductase subunit J family protein [Acidimicrobiales bacterium]